MHLFVRAKYDRRGLSRRAPRHILQMGNHFVIRVLLVPPKGNRPTFDGFVGLKQALERGGESHLLGGRIERVKCIVKCSSDCAAHALLDLLGRFDLGPCACATGCGRRVRCRGRSWGRGGWVVRAVDGDLPDLWIATVARAARLLGDAEGDDVTRVVGRVEASGAHDARVIECAVPISNENAVR
jgi:hypothetical protein